LADTINIYAGPETIAVGDRISAAEIASRRFTPARIRISPPNPPPAVSFTRKRFPRIQWSAAM
jgi:hypothetical protein